MDQLYSLMLLELTKSIIILIVCRLLNIKIQKFKENKLNVYVKLNINSNNKNWISILITTKKKLHVGYWAWYLSFGSEASDDINTTNCDDWKWNDFDLISEFSDPFWLKFLCFRELE